MFVIAVDGIDGAGKTEFCKGLQQYITDTYNQGVVISSDLRNSFLGKEVRDLICSGRLTPLEELYLICAARSQHCRWIRDCMAKSVAVILDRFSLSTYAYQGAGGGLDSSYISMVMNPLDTEHVDLQFVLNVSLPTARARLRQRGVPDGIERRDSEYAARVAAFFELSCQTPGYVDIDAEQTQEQMLFDAIPFIDGLIDKCEIPRRALNG